MYRYLIVVEKATDNYSCYSPDLPGCAATGKTRQEAEGAKQKAMELHIQGLVAVATAAWRPIEQRRLLL